MFLFFEISFNSFNDKFIFLIPGEKVFGSRESDHIFYCRSKLIFRQSRLQKYVKWLDVLSYSQIKKSCSLIIV